MLSAVCQAAKLGGACCLDNTFWHGHGVSSILLGFLLSDELVVIFFEAG
jgi:hypothetical protein